MKFKVTALLVLLCVTSPNAICEKNSEACKTNRNAPPMSNFYWPPNTDVKVFLVRSMFSSDQVQALFDVMSFWNHSSRQTGAGVRYSYAGESNGLEDCSGCLTLKRSEVHKYDRKHYAFFYPMRWNQKGLLISAWINFDFATVDLTALKAFMAHELGHGMGLWDCTSCKKKQTIMNSFPGINNDNGRTGPSPCDLEVVRQVYERHRKLAANDNEIDHSKAE
jgi:hypothetical protein